MNDRRKMTSAASPARRACGPPARDRRCRDGAGRRKTAARPRPASYRRRRMPIRHQQRRRRSATAAWCARPGTRTGCGRRPVARSAADSAPSPAVRPRPRAPPDADRYRPARHAGKLHHSKRRRISGVPKISSPRVAIPGTTFDIETPTASGQISTANPASGPPMPISNRMRLDRIAERMRMNAPQGSDQRRRGKEKRQRRVHAVIARGEVVAHLVRQQNRQQRQRKRQARPAGTRDRATSRRSRSDRASKSKGRFRAKLCARPAPTTVVVSSVSSSSSACSQ